MGEGLQGFAEAHVIGEDPVEAAGCEELQPIVAFQLVVAQGGLHPGRWLRFLRFLQFAQALGKFCQIGSGIEGELRFVGEIGGIDRVEEGLAGIDEGSKLAKNTPQAVDRNVEGAPVGNIDEVVRATR